MPPKRFGIIDGVHTEQNMETVLNQWSVFPRWHPREGSTVLLKNVYIDTDGCHDTHYYIARYANGKFILGVEYSKSPFKEVRLHDRTYWKYLD